MFYVAVILGLSSAWPLFEAWRNTAGSTIRHPLAWTALAWAAWMAFGWFHTQNTAYAAMTLTVAAGIAVFGARRPGVVAWHFVVLGLLAVLWLPWTEAWLTATPLRLDTFRRVFLNVLFAVVALNYLPTRLFFPTIYFVFAWWDAYRTLVQPNESWKYWRTEFNAAAVYCSLAATTWFARRILVMPRSGSLTDQIWARFRDRFGVVWAMRLREQFNAAAHNAGWSVRLGWFGLTPKTDSVDPEIHAALVALQKRFGME